jgi:tetratricopeptide (TPR) repeat protein
VEIVEKRGQAYLAEGQELARAGRWSEAVNLLRLGLARFPNDRRARLTLARFYELTQQPGLARQVLHEGLRDEYPGKTYLENLFRIALQGEDFEAVAEVSARYLLAGTRNGTPPDRLWLEETRYRALTSAGRHAEALALAETEVAGDRRDERRVLSLLALKRRAQAEEVLAEWRRRAGADLRHVTRLEVKLWREVGRFSEMERALAELRERSPGDPAPLVYAVVQQTLAGRETAAAAALADFIFRYGGSAENLLLAAAPLGEIGRVPLLESCLAAARERGFAVVPFQELLLEANLQTGDWEAAFRWLTALPAVTGKDGARTKEREWLRLLLEAARSRTAGPTAALVELLRDPRWPLRSLRKSAEAMARAGHLEAARDILEGARRVYPASKELQVLADEVKVRLMARSPALPAPPAGSQASSAAATAFAQRLEQLLRAKNWAEASRHITHVQSLRPEPEWLERQNARIGMAQVRIACAGGNPVQVTAAARLFLNGELGRTRDLMEVAREHFSQGEKLVAITIARAIAERLPDFVAARQALTEWDPAGDLPVAPERKAETTSATASVALAVQLAERRREGNIPRMLAAARLLLTGEHSGAEQVLGEARKAAEAGDSAAAQLLVKEVLRRHPDYPPARRLLQEWAESGGARK